MEKKNRTLVIGDIHGNYRGLLQALKRSKFDYKNDILISLGDVVDGHSESFEVVEELLKIKNLIAIKGNHDDWFNTWLQTGNNPSNWKQGQQATGESYLKQYTHLPWLDYGSGIPMVRLTTNYIPDSHIEFFNNQLPYYIDDKNRLFIHGGFDRHKKLEDQDPFYFWWDRDLWKQALSFEGTVKNDKNNTVKPKFNMVESFEHIYIGHTQTQFWKVDTPMTAAHITNMDTGGGGWFGFISIMDVDTGEFWQSDSGKELYPEFKGRS